jgi:hypothetical protein
MDLNVAHDEFSLARRPKKARTAAMDISESRRSSWTSGLLEQLDSSNQLRRASWPLTGKKSVTFSKYSEMTHIDYPTARENHARWYSDEQMRTFKKVVLRDATRHSSGYFEAKEKSPDAILPHGELVQYVGLLHLLSEDVIQRYQDNKLARRLHVYKVLEEQKRQRSYQDGCEVKLARVSASSSLGARESAYTVANLFMRVDKCL